MKNLTYQEIDWNKMRQKALKKQAGNKKSSLDWDKRAPSFAKRTSKSIYVDKFMELLAPEKKWSILDVGSGPGTLAIPLASKVRSISCLDYSNRMLQILARKAKELSLKNIHCYNCSWEDNWKRYSIPVHDVAIASRSLAIDDLRQGLKKLCRFATKKIVVTDRVSYGPKDPFAFKALGRKLLPGPDYIFTLNILHQMGIQASCNFIELTDQNEYSSIEEAVAAYSWMFGELTEKEKKKLKKYVRSITTKTDNEIIHLHKEYIPKWAFISWEL